MQYHDNARYIDCASIEQLKDINSKHYHGCATCGYDYIEPVKRKLVAHDKNFTSANTKEEAIAILKSKGLVFGWFNGEFITAE